MKRKQVTFWIILLIAVSIFLYRPSGVSSDTFGVTPTPVQPTPEPATVLEVQVVLPLVAR